MLYTKLSSMYVHAVKWHKERLFTTAVRWRSTIFVIVKWSMWSEPCRPIVTFIFSDFSSPYGLHVSMHKISGTGCLYNMPDWIYKLIGYGFWTIILWKNKYYTDISLHLYLHLIGVLINDTLHSSFTKSRALAWTARPCRYLPPTTGSRVRSGACIFKYE